MVAFRSRALALSLAALLPLSSAAAEPIAVVAGIVVDESGGAIDGAEVRVVTATEQVAAAEKTDAQGVFFTQVEPGDLSRARSTRRLQGRRGDHRRAADG
jgi:hypothetical protein